MERVVCCFTGHRPQNLKFGYNEHSFECIRLKKLLRKAIIGMITKYNVSHFISGMALGVDMYAAEIVLEVKKEFPNVILECAIPCRTQATKWSSHFVERYNNIVDNADVKTILQESYTKDCMRKRNEYMINHSNYVIAVFNGESGGTANTINYARKNKKKILIINPDSFKGEMI